jgi:hypothetical protein
LVAAANAWLGVPLNAQPSIAGLAAFVLIVGASYPCAMLVARLAAGLGAALHRHRTAHAGAQPKNIGGA